MLAADGFVGTVQTGPILLAAAVAVLVGVVGFLSPCVLPLVPGYLSYVAGLSGEAAPSQRRMLGGALLFVLGFTVVLTAQGALLFQLGTFFRQNNVLLQRIFGVIVIVLGVVFLGGFGFLQREWRVHKLPRPGLLGAPLLGLGFGLAWTPCLTPTFAAVVGLSSGEQTAGRGTLLTVFYCLGLGLPFLLVAAGFGWMTGAVDFVRRHRRVVSAVGGGLLVVIGVLLVSGLWNELVIQLQTSVPPDAGVQL